jgi:hypothetical protein
MRGIRQNLQRRHVVLRPQRRPARPARRQNGSHPWKLRLEGGGYVERLTFFSDYPGYKASNPVVSDDGRFMAFQMAKSKDAAGVGHGIFVMDLEKPKK